MVDDLGGRGRHHLHESVVQRAMHEAVRRSGIAKRGTRHSLRHSSAVLDEMGTEHSQPFVATLGDSEFRMPGRRVYAAVRGFRRGNLLADGVFVVVSLDSEDRVLDYQARYSYTFP